jgi:hypothetical protein
MAAVCEECRNDEYGVIFQVEVTDAGSRKLTEMRDFHLACLSRYMLSHQDQMFRIARRVPAGFQQDGLR